MIVILARASAKGDCAWFASKICRGPQLLVASLTAYALLVCCQRESPLPSQISAAPRRNRIENAPPPEAFRVLPPPDAEGPQITPYLLYQTYARMAAGCAARLAGRR